MKTRYLIVAVALCALAGCAQIAQQENSASALPSAATLTLDCNAGLAKTPPVRTNACDLLQFNTAICQMQGALPLNMTAACALAGYPTSPTATTNPSAIPAKTSQVESAPTIASNQGFVVRKVPTTAEICMSDGKTRPCAAGEKGTLVVLKQAMPTDWYRRMRVAD